MVGKLGSDMQSCPLRCPLAIRQGLCVTSCIASEVQAMPLSSHAIPFSLSNVLPGWTIEAVCVSEREVRSRGY